MNQRRAQGIRAEAIAADYLQRRGYRVLARNWSCRVGELDLVFRFIQRWLLKFGR